MAQDARDHLLTGSIVQPLTTQIIRDSVPGYALGTSHFLGNPSEVCEKFIGCTTIWGLDVSGMDRSVDMPTLGSSTLSFLLDRSTATDCHKQFIFDSVYTKSLCMPDGAVYMIQNGLASGHGVTSLLETTLMIRVIYASFLRLLLDEGFDWSAAERMIRRCVVLEVLGDDGRIGLQPDLAEIVTWPSFRFTFESLFHGTLKPSACIQVDYPTGFGVGCSLPLFLGKTYDYIDTFTCFVGRPILESLAIALWPERGVTHPAQSFATACGLLIDNCNPEWQRIIRDYLAYLTESYPITPTCWPREVSRDLLFSWLSSIVVDRVGSVARCLSYVELADLYDIDVCYINNLNI